VKHVERHRKRLIAVIDSDSDEDPQLSLAKKRKGNRDMLGECYCGYFIPNKRAVIYKV
jgi:hypothetical protein